jgi:hypothetical protein
MEGYERVSETVTVREGTVTDISRALVRLTGTVAVITRPTGARVYLDGRLVGVSPERIPDVPTGRHRIVLERRGHERTSVEIVVEAGKTKVVNEKLERAPLTPTRPARPRPRLPDRSGR